MTGWWLYFLTLLPLPPASVSLRGSAGLAASSLLPADTPQLSPTLCRAANLQHSNVPPGTFDSPRECGPGCSRS